MTSVTGLPRGRVAVAVAVGMAVTAASAVVLGDYPLSGAVPWVTPIVIPLLIGAAMTLIDKTHAPWLWVLTGPLAALGVLWGARIATGWGLDPWPTSWWAVVAVALLWPPLWGATSHHKGGPSAASQTNNVRVAEDG